MFLRFTGIYTGGRSSITLCGVTFEGREPSLVTGEEALRRLSNHPEFERVGEAQETAELPDFSEYVPPKPRGRPRKP
jgi:hypothetical protein